MKEILINVSKETRMVDLNKSVIGNDGENLQGKLIFTFIDEFVNGQARLEYEIKGNKNYILLDKKNDTYTIPVKNVITKEGQIDMQLVITEGTDEEEIPVFKSNKFYLFCNSSINAVSEAPDGYELWIEKANTKLNEVDNVDIDIQDNVVTITRKDGTVKSENVKGDKGEKGDAGSIRFIIANELPTENIDESAIYMIPSSIPDTTNTYEEYIYVNGVWESLGSASVNVDLTDYVKFTDFGSLNRAGVVGINSAWGIAIHNNGRIMINSAKSSDIVAGTNGFLPITPNRQHESVFYGLKALSQSGAEYTEEEQKGIKRLFGIPAQITLTQTEYDALETKDENTYYYIVEE